MSLDIVLLILFVVIFLLAGGFLVLRLRVHQEPLCVQGFLAPVEGFAFWMAIWGAVNIVACIIFTVPRESWDPVLSGWIRATAALPLHLSLLTYLASRFLELTRVGHGIRLRVPSESAIKRTHWILLVLYTLFWQEIALVRGHLFSYLPDDQFHTAIKVLTEVVTLVFFAWILTMIAGFAYYDRLLATLSTRGASLLDNAQDPESANGLPGSSSSTQESAPELADQERAIMQFSSKERKANSVFITLIVIYFMVQFVSWVYQFFELDKYTGHSSFVSSFQLLTPLVLVIIVLVGMLYMEFYRRPLRV